MRLIALMPVRNEGWVLGLSARVALLWCDELVILLHACTDNSAAIAEEIQNEHRGRVHLLVEPEDKWDEMRHRQELLCGARAFGASHIALVDADEVMTGNITAFKTEEYMKLDARMVLQFPLYNTRGSHMRYHLNGTWGQRWVTTAFVDDMRLHWRGDTFHKREPQGLNLQPWRPIQQGSGGVIHLWGASERRLRAKHALYKMTETLRWPHKSKLQIDAYYNQAMQEQPGGWKLAQMPEEWWKPYEEMGWMKCLELDAAPWQENKCQELLAEHGAPRFIGLDLFGVV